MTRVTRPWGVPGKSSKRPAYESLPTATEEVQTSESGAHAADDLSCSLTGANASTSYPSGIILSADQNPPLVGCGLEDRQYKIPSLLLTVLNEGAASRIC